MTRIARLLRRLADRIDPDGQPTVVMPLVTVSSGPIGLKGDVRILGQKTAATKPRRSVV